MTYYHWCPTLLGEESIIEPGNFGRIINCYSGIKGLAGREIFFEKYRRKYYKEKPSRLKSCFVCKSLFDACAYVFYNMQFSNIVNTNILYEVEVLNPNNGHMGDVFFLDDKGVPFRNWAPKAAELYWSGQPSGVLKIKEHIYESRLRIVKKLMDDWQAIEIFKDPISQRLLSLHEQTPFPLERIPPVIDIINDLLE